MKTLILGIGNPIVTDDSAGLKIAQRIKERNPELEVIEACSGALGLLDDVAGYDKLIIIDSVKTEGGKPGELYKLELEDLNPTLEHATSHGLDIASAFKLGEGLGYKMPQSVIIYAVEIKDNTNFGEECTKEVAERIPLLAQQIMEEENL
ncbi:MAG: hydrogenase maturation protease [Dehalococcoidia bacterium]|nr:hydrogenase maturation protease [Dehalococcoidia bacterium]